MFPLVSGICGFHARGTAWREQGSTRQDVGGGSGVLRRSDGLLRGGFCDGDAEEVGEDVHRDEGILRLTGGAADSGVVRARKLPADGGCGVVRGTARPNVAANVNLGAFYLVGMPWQLGLRSGSRLGSVGSGWACCRPRIRRPQTTVACLVDNNNS
ncbi:hypothetical protein JHK82_043326 [Glycine max]|nr:hypothetical protein JHK82_043326 [Glycine max]